MSATLGLAACALSSFCYGSMYVAVRKYDTGDGIFCQWVIGVSIFLIGMVVNAFTGFPPFQPLAMIGGAIWTLGNAMALPVIRLIGLGMGILIWGSTNCLIGWAIGRFGWFGIHADVPQSPLLNYFGLFLVLIGGFIFVFVKPTMKAPSDENSVHASVFPEEEKQKDDKKIVFENMDIESKSDGGSTRDEPQLHVVGADDGVALGLKEKLLAIALSAFSGLCYGSNFVPVIYIQHNQEEFDHPSSRGIDYTFSHFAGIFATSTIIMLGYATLKRNRPFVNEKTILPSYFAGLLWATAQIAWFYANDILSQAVTFPINSMMPGVCAAVWSVFYFQEIRGRRNLQILGIAILITSLGAILVGVSKGF